MAKSNKKKALYAISLQAARRLPVELDKSSPQNRQRALAYLNATQAQFVTDAEREHAQWPDIAIGMMVGKLAGH
ncbi:hypothetical protein ACFOLJ_16735 [Rugamonas sp. CCM 8940]|uniref:hypothetical protein n=1 Tax=Rugamonas sp. CCM 8940 TaxID=2765359 RepID=UPI0018F6D960|nr:hypothetical protein [Rugamonas sp. CCM 8940]MBJ7311034.1 hypothetical protein [Rugamonas sp. CCM 8940]